MEIYYPDGNGGRRILSGGDTYIQTPQEGTVIFRGVIKTAETLAQVQTTNGTLGDLWTIAFDSDTLDVHAGDLLIFDGEEWQVLGTSRNRPFYTLPTASESVKGGVVIGDGLQMTGDTLNAVTAQEYSLPTASTSIKGGFIVGKGLYMDGDTLNVSTAEDDLKKTINIKNVLKGNGGGSGSSGGGTFLLGTTPLTEEGSMWLSV